MQEQKRSDKKTLIFNLFLCICAWVWTGFCTAATGYKSTMQRWFDIKLFIVEKNFRWKISFKIAQRNVNLDTRNDIDR